MPVILGGETAWKVAKRGEFVVSHQWISGEPAMCVYRHARRTPDAGALVVRLQDCHKWADPVTGSVNPDYAVPMTVRALSIMGGFPTSTAAGALMDTVLMGIPDLIAMPPEPIRKPQGPAIADAILRVDGEVVREEEVKAA